VCSGARNGRQCELKRSGPGKEEAVRPEDPRDDGERIFGPCERRTVTGKENAHCAVLKRGYEKEKEILLVQVEGERRGRELTLWVWRGEERRGPSTLIGFYWLINPQSLPPSACPPTRPHSQPRQRTLSVPAIGGARK
jgi:hypothetical protein